MLVKILKMKTHHKIKIHLLVVYTLYISLYTLSSPYRVVSFIILLYCTSFCVYIAYREVDIPQRVGE